MASFGYGLGAFGSGFVPGLGAGLELYDKYTDIQAQALAAEALKKSGLDPTRPTPALGGLDALGRPVGAPGGGGGYPGAPGAAPTPLWASMGGAEAVAPGGPMRTTPTAAQPASIFDPTPAYAMEGTIAGGPRTQPGLTPVPVTPQAQPPSDIALSDVSRVPASAGTFTQDPNVPAVSPLAARAQARVEPSLPDPVGAARFYQTGQGWLSETDLARRIEAANPDASPQVKFKAMLAASKLMNQGGKDHFSQMMRIMEFRQRQELHDRKSAEEDARAAKREKDAERADERLRLQQEKADPQYIRYKKTTTDLGSRSDQAQAFMGGAEKNMDTLIELAKKLPVTGIVPLDRWWADVKAKFGDAQMLEYQKQHALVVQQIGRLLSGGMGNAALTEGVRKDAYGLLDKMVPVEALIRQKALMIQDAKNARAGYEDEIKRATKRYFYYKKHHVLPPDDEEAPLSGGGGGAGGGTGDWR